MHDVPWCVNSPVYMSNGMSDSDGRSTKPNVAWGSMYPRLSTRHVTDITFGDVALVTGVENLCAFSVTHCGPWPATTDATRVSQPVHAFVTDSRRATTKLCGMRFTTRTSLILFLALGSFVAASVTGLAQRGSTAPTTAVAPAATAARIVTAAQAVLATLDAAGRATVQFPFEGPQTTRWSNFPSGIFQREGLRLGDITPAQRAAVDTLLSTALSPDGYRKVTEIIGADEALRKTEAAGGQTAPGGRGRGTGGLGGPGGSGCCWRLARRWSPPI